MSARQGKLRIGTSGYQYDHWRGVFYARDIPKPRWFAYYTSHFDTVEINHTFYRLPQAQTFDVWREQAPKNFCYALKFSRYGSHLKHLKEPHESMHKFLDRASRLAGFLGPILVQLPPTGSRIRAVLRAFFRRHRATTAGPSNYATRDGSVTKSTRS
jgi:uncharacterized protein YecE (DUF72 family)